MPNCKKVIQKHVLKTVIFKNKYLQNSAVNEIYKINHNYVEQNKWDEWKSFVADFYKNYKKYNDPNISPLIVEKPFDNRPHIEIDIYGYLVIALLDSGASRSVIGKDAMFLIEKFNLKIDKCSEKCVRTADGKPQSIIGYVYVPIRVGNICKVFEILLVPSVTQSLILGSDFCKEFCLEINFKNNIWKVDSNIADCQIEIAKQLNNLVAGNLCSIEDLSPEQKEKVIILKNSFNEISLKDRLGLTSKLIMHIDTGDSKPFKVRQYPFSPYMMNILNKELDEMLRLGVVEPSHSAWNSPVLLVKKKSGEYRFCFDGRRLNRVIKPDAYPLPRVDRILSLLKGAKFMSSIDLSKAFWQIPLDEQSKEKTAFSVPGRGLFHFKVVPFGLIHSAQCQQRLMDAIFGPELEPKVFCYLDDIIVISSSFDEHIRILREVLTRLKAANLTVNFEKCEFFKSSLKYLGYVVDSEGLRTDPDKISSMINYPRPTNTTEIKRFIGMTSWYRKFINHFSTLVSPINDLIKGRKKGQKITWTPEAENSFINLKQALVSAPILRSPDFSQPFIIQCDASDTGLAGVLLQYINGEEVVIAFASRSLSRTERNYSITQRECLAVIFSIEKFRPFVEGVHFTVVTDHYSLLWLNNLKEPTGKLARWAVKVQQFSFTLVHRKGSLNVVPDALSRIPENVDKDSKEISSLCILDVSLDNLDNFYLRMRERIRKEPRKFPLWQVKDNFLYRYVPSRIPFNSNFTEWKIVVPKSQKFHIMRLCHDPPTSGHFGFFKTLAKIQENYYWPKMRRDVLRYVRSCHICASQKVSSTARMGLMGSEKKVNFPFQIIAVDLVGPLPRSSHGYTHLLVIGDWFSKYTLLCPLRKATAPNIVKFIENEVFLVYGVPQFIICDNGKQFVGKTFKALVKKYEVQKIWLNALYHPQVNFVERSNQTIGRAIRSYIIEDHHKDWDKYLPEIRYAINSACHEVTGFPPSFLNFARKVPISGKYYGEIDSTEGIQLLPADRLEFSNNLKSLGDIFAKVKLNLNKAYQRNAKRYNLRKRDISFNVGEKVWRRNKVLSDAANQFSAKLAPKYVLCKIVNKISRLVYGLKNMDGSDAGEWHTKDLKPYYGSNSDVSVG